MFQFMRAHEGKNGQLLNPSTSSHLSSRLTILLPKYSVFVGLQNHHHSSPLLLRVYRHSQNL